MSSINPSTPINTPQPSLSSHQQRGQSPRLTPSGPSFETETAEEAINVFLDEHTTEVLEDRPASDLFPISPRKEENRLTKFYKKFSEPLDRYKELNSWCDKWNADDADKIIDLFHEDAFERLCPDGERIKEKFTQENLLKWISCIKTRVKEEEYSIREIIEYLEWNVKEADKDKEPIALLMIRKLIREFSPPRGEKSQPSTSQDQDHMRDKIREALPNFSEEQSWNDISKQIKVFFRQEWAKTIIEAIKTKHLLRLALLAAQISESGVKNSSFRFISFAEDQFWVDTVQDFFCMPLHTWHPGNSESYTKLLKCYTEAEHLFAKKEPIPLSHWEPMRPLSRWDTILRNKKEEKKLIHSYYDEKFKKITQNRERVYAFIKYKIQEKRDLELKYLFNALEKGYHLPTSSSFYQTSCRITKKYFLKAILEDEAVMKKLYEEGQNHSFHYKLIRDMIQKNSVSLFLSEDLPPTTLFDNTYAILLCKKIFENGVRSKTLDISEDEKKRLENFFSGQLAGMNVEKD